ncbi:ATP-binding cassette domain-containing protein [Streptomyces iakyrus]|uniref:ATP-binding cassette domain-containing protein n=1 Tax=Streptomyces iakyrus TaxID=68219 RepID=A0ABW8FQW2_9ACTN
MEVRGLRKRYGDVTAVDGIGPAVRRGEVFCLLGPHGAGKSTTVEILRGNRDRDAGEVAVLGSYPATCTRAWRSRAGIAWQDESAPAELTVRETVRHFARDCPRPRGPEEVIVLTGLEAKADSRIKALSGGRRRRPDVALGVTGGADLLLPGQCGRGGAEALANARKHAGSSTAVGVSLAYADDSLTVSVRDDGRGFDPSAACGGYTVWRSCGPWPPKRVAPPRCAAPRATARS